MFEFVVDDPLATLWRFISAPVMNNTFFKSRKCSPCKKHRSLARSRKLSPELEVRSLYDDFGINDLSTCHWRAIDASMASTFKLGNLEPLCTKKIYHMPSRDRERVSQSSTSITSWFCAYIEILWPFLTPTTPLGGIWPHLQSYRIYLGFFLNERSTPQVTGKISAFPWKSRSEAPQHLQKFRYHICWSSELTFLESETCDFTQDCGGYKSQLDHIGASKNVHEQKYKRGGTCRLIATIQGTVGMRK